MKASDRKFKFGIILLLLCTLTGCGIPQISVEERLFLDLSLEFLDEYQLPKTIFEETPVGGLSAITYDRQTGKFYVLSDDRSNLAPARFYTLNLALKTTATEEITIDSIDIEDVTFLRTPEGDTYPPGEVDPEGMILSPTGTVFISSEGIPKKGINPFIAEFNRETGQQQQSLPIPERYFPSAEEENPRGVRENLGFEALTLHYAGLSAASGAPFDLFTATESALAQDSFNEAGVAPLRFMYYVINTITSPVLEAEYLYFIDPPPENALANGLCELLVLPTEGYLLSLERTFSPSGVGVKLFQIVIGNASDTSRLETVNDGEGFNPIQKKLLLDLRKLGITLDNLEGMTLGPQLPDGSQSLILVSDDNFREEQVTQFLLFRLK